MRCFLVLALLLFACTEEKEPKTTMTTTSAATSGAGGGQPCTGTEGDVTGVVYLTEFGMGGAQPAPDTEVSFLPATGEPFVVRSDAEALYTARLPAGHYDLQGTPGKCVYPPLDVTIEACETTTLDVMLELCVGNEG
jgi:hypothetical protein